MKVLQTLGASGRTGLPGIFFYKRTFEGVNIYNPDVSSGDEPTLHISNKDWKDILSAISERGAFTLSSEDPEKGLYGILNECGYNGTTDRARIAAILEHEGSIDLNGKGNCSINLVSNI